MTSFVFTNDMTAHVWAQQSQSHGRSNNGNLYFEGPTLFSYGSHYPVGHFANIGGQGSRPWLNSSPSTPTTEGKHKNAARRALPAYGRDAIHMPALDEILPVLRRADLNGGRVPPDYIAGDSAIVRRYLAEHWESIAPDAEGPNLLLRAIGSRATWHAIRGTAERKAARESEKQKRARNARNVANGRRLAALSIRALVDSSWLKADSYRQIDLRESISEIRAARLATAKGHKRIRAGLLQRERAMRAVLAWAEHEADGRAYGGDRLKARVAIVTLRRLRDGIEYAVPGYDGPDGPGRLQAALDLPHGAGWRRLADLLGTLLPLVRVPSGLRAKAEQLKTEAERIASERESAESIRRERRAAISRVTMRLGRFNRARRAHRAAINSGTWESRTDRIKADMLSEIIGTAPRLDDMTPAWAEDKALHPGLKARAERIAKRAADIAAEHVTARDSHWRAYEAEQEARRLAARENEARIANMSPAELRAAWAAGELDSRHVYALERESGPLLRAIGAEIDGCTVKGGVLQTSQGASVPLRHAFRVFQFVALCRAERKAWAPRSGFGPARIRVGHFQLDSVDTQGNFVAGCHAIQWPEIERLARSLGVLDCLAELPAIAAELESESA